MQCIDNKANKRTMIKGRASPVAITYRPQLKRHVTTKQGKYEIYKYTHKNIQ